MKLPTEVVVTKNFNHEEVIGMANVFEEDGKVVAECSVTNESYFEERKNMLEFGVAGRVLEREGNVIKKFDLTSVSILYKRDQESRPKLYVNL